VAADEGGDEYLIFGSEACERRHIEMAFDRHVPIEQPDALDLKRGSSGQLC
jgi:hypothetical protein